MNMSKEDERGLVRHGIGRKYHHLELEDIPGSEQLLDYLDLGEFPGYQGISLIGGFNTYKMFQVFTRDVFMRNIPVFVTHADNLIDIDFKTQEIIDGTHILFVSNLHRTITPNECPWRPPERAKLTNFLEDYWLSGRTTVTCMPNTMKPVPGWFGLYFVAAHNENNHQIVFPV